MAREIRDVILHREVELPKGALILDINRRDTPKSDLPKNILAHEKTIATVLADFTAETELRRFVFISKLQQCNEDELSFIKALPSMDGETYYIFEVVGREPMNLAEPYSIP